MVTITAPQTPDWQGSSGDIWHDNQARLDRMLMPLGSAAIAAAATVRGEAVIDIGCGPGTTSFALAQLVGMTGHVLGIDISPRLIESADSDQRKDKNVAFHLGDAAAVALPVAAFDLLFSRFGVMFFDNPVAAFAHLRTALKPNGRLTFICWRAASENEWVRLPLAAVSDFIALPPSDPTAPGPFAFADANRVDDILTRAGFADIELTPFDASITFGEGATQDDAVKDALDHCLAIGPLARALTDQPGDVHARARLAVQDALAARCTGPHLQLNAATWIVTARNRE